MNAIDLCRDNENTENRPWVKNYDPGTPEHIDYPSTPLFRFLEESAKKYPDKTCTIFKGASISYKEMNELTDKMAAALVGLGVKKGDRIGIFMPNTPQFVITYFGVLKAGGVIVAINPLFKEREIEDQVNNAGIEVIFVMSNSYGLIKKVQPQTMIRKVIVTNIKEYLPPLLNLLFGLTKEKKEGHKVSLDPADSWFRDILEPYKPEDRPNLEIVPHDIALFQYSGGTTGTPKGAVCSHSNLVANVLQIRHWLSGMEYGREAFMIAIPLYHVYGMVMGMCFAIYIGASMVLIPNPRDLTDLLGSLQNYKATFFPGVPTLYNAINNHPDVIAGKYNLSSIKACISGSAPLVRETKDKFEALTGGKLLEGYGLSEAPTATHCNPMFGENRSGSIGLPFPDVDCQIIDPDDGITVLKVGEVGELVIKSPQVMKGYHNMPAETEKVIRNEWLYTGDIARMDRDGYFFIVGRKKELIKPSGNPVWPSEVEKIIISNPKVLEVCVAGVPDDYRGETVKAWIVLKPEEEATEEEIRNYCKENMAAFKVPTQVEFRKALPKTTVGKVLRRELVREHMEMLPEIKT